MFTVHLELWPGNHVIWCGATYRPVVEVHSKKKIIFLFFSGAIIMTDKN